MTKKKRSVTRRGAFAYEGLDRVLHEKARLGILTALLNRPEGLRFTELKELCSLTDGNLSRHIQVLLEGGLIQVWKGKEEGRSQTLVRLSKRGRRQFVAYLEELERVIEDARRQTARSNAHNPSGFAPA
jgi:DNA-binding MarR family transcriptional regulator